MSKTWLLTLEFRSRRHRLAICGGSGAGSDDDPHKIVAGGDVVVVTITTGSGSSARSDWLTCSWP